MWFIIPFRSTTQPEREGQLLKLTWHLNDSVSECNILVAQQDDNLQFNRGALFNAAVTHALSVKLFGLDDIICLHDVDLLVPDPLRRAYERKLPVHTVRHIGTIPRYQGMGNAYFGGIVMLRVVDYVAVGGHDNTYWGWGGEDKDFKKRVRRLGLSIEYARGDVMDLEGFDNYEQKIQHNRDTRNCGRHRKSTAPSAKVYSVIDDVRFQTIGFKTVSVFGQAVSVLGVRFADV